MKHVFGTVGLPGSGKSTFSEIASDEFDVETVSMGDIVREMAHEEGHTTSNEIGKFADEMRDAYGKEVFVEKLLERLNFDEDEVVIIDGIRSVEEIEQLRESTDAECTIVYVQASEGLRRKRVDERGRGENFDERDERERKWGFTEIVQDNYFDVLLKNEHTLENFQDDIEKVINATLQDSQDELNCSTMATVSK